MNSTLVLGFRDFFFHFLGLFNAKNFCFLFWSISESTFLLVFFDIKVRNVVSLWGFYVWIFDKFA